MPELLGETMDRTLNVTTPLGPEVLRFDGLQGKESLSQLFDFQLTLKSEEKGCRRRRCWVSR